MWIERTVPELSCTSCHPNMLDEKLCSNVRALYALLFHDLLSCIWQFLCPFGLCIRFTSMYVCGPSV